MYNSKYSYICLELGAWETWNFLVLCLSLKRKAVQNHRPTHESRNSHMKLTGKAKENKKKEKRAKLEGPCRTAYYLC